MIIVKTDKMPQKSSTPGKPSFWKKNYIVNHSQHGCYIYIAYAKLAIFGQYLAVSVKGSIYDLKCTTKRDLLRGPRYILW